MMGFLEVTVISINKSKSLKEIPFWLKEIKIFHVYRN